MSFARNISSIYLLVSICLAFILSACDDGMQSDNTPIPEIVGGWQLRDSWRYLWVIPALEQITIDPSSQIIGDASVRGKYSIDFKYSWQGKFFLSPNEIGIVLTTLPLWENFTRGLTLIDSSGHRRCEFSYRYESDSLNYTDYFINYDVEYEYDKTTGQLSLSKTVLWTPDGNDSVVAEIDCLTPLFHLIPGDTVMAWPRHWSTPVDNIIQITFDQANITTIEYDSTVSDTSVYGIWETVDDSVIITNNEGAYQYIYSINSDTLQLCTLPDTLSASSLNTIEYMGFLDEEALEKAWWIYKSNYVRIHDSTDSLY